MTKGKLIVLEGLDKAGKETQAELLAQYLENKGFEVGKHEFPNYNTSSGSLIKRYLAGMEDLSQRTINMIYSTNRYEQKSYIEKGLNLGIIVICDRYYYSNMAYGSFDGQTMQEIEEMDSEMPRPDLVVYLDVHPKITEQRCKFTAPDRNEQALGFLKKVRYNYHTLQFYPHGCDWVTLNGEEDKQEIHEQIVSLVENRLFKK